MSGRLSLNHEKESSIDRVSSTDWSRQRYGTAEGRGGEHKRDFGWNSHLRLFLVASRRTSCGNKVVCSYMSWTWYDPWQESCSFTIENKKLLEYLIQNNNQSTMSKFLTPYLSDSLKELEYLNYLWHQSWTLVSVTPRSRTHSLVMWHDENNITNPSSRDPTPLPKVLWNHSTSVSCQRPRDPVSREEL